MGGNSNIRFIYFYMGLKEKSAFLVTLVRMKAEITYLADECFGHISEGISPELEWEIFREGLKKLKKEYIKAHRDYMESDADDEE